MVVQVENRLPASNSNMCMSENYLTVIEGRLREMFANVENGSETVDNAVTFLKDELLASYRRGRDAGKQPRKTARPESSRKAFTR